MKHDNNADFLAKCRDIDFSAESSSYEETLEMLKNKLSQHETERFGMKKTFTKPSFAIAAVLIATLSLSVVAFGGQTWRYLQTRILEGHEFVSEYVLKESEYGTIGSMTIADWEAMQQEGSRVVVEIDGAAQVISDPIHFADLDEALSHLEIENVLLPGYLPEGFVFDRATFSINPITNPDELMAAKMMRLHYTNGADTIVIHISFWEPEWGLGMAASDQEDIYINGHIGGISEEMGFIMLPIGNAQYFINAEGLSRETLMRIAESLQ